MLKDFTDEATRLIRIGLNPRTTQLALVDISWTIFTVLIEAGCDTARADELREIIQKPSWAWDDEDRKDPGATAKHLDATAKEFRPNEPGRQACLAILRAQIYKREPKPKRVPDVLAQLKWPVVGALEEARWKLYVSRWKRLGMVKAEADRSEPARSTLQQLLDAVIGAEPIDAVERYRAVIDHYVRQPTAAARQEIATTADRFPFKTSIVARPIQREGSEGMRSTQSYLPLELPLPLLAPRRTLVEIVAILRQEFPWLVAVIDCVELDLCVSQRFLDGIPCLAPKLLLGAAGSGKTSFCSRLAELLDQPSAVVNAAGATSVKLLTGTTRGWGGARPSLPSELLAQHRRPQACITIDEIDKEASRNEYGKFSDGLLNLTEPSTASSYWDECLFAACDFTRVTWLATANELTPISQPLQSRFQIIPCEQPSGEHMGAIVDATLRMMRRQYRLPEAHDLLDSQARHELESQARHSQSARACAHLTRRKVSESLRREFRNSDSTRLPPVASAERMH